MVYEELAFGCRGSLTRFVERARIVSAYLRGLILQFSFILSITVVSLVVRASLSFNPKLYDANYLPTKQFRREKTFLETNGLLIARAKAPFIIHRQSDRELTFANLPSDECTNVTKIHAVHGIRMAVIIVIFIISVRLSLDFRHVTRTGIKPTRAGVQMQTDLSYGILQEQHDTHASWLPRACLFRVFTSHRDNCDFPDNSFYLTAQRTGGHLRTYPCEILSSGVNSENNTWSQSYTIHSMYRMVYTIYLFVSFFFFVSFIT